MRHATVGLASALAALLLLAPVASGQDEPPGDASVLLRWSFPEGDARPVRYEHVQKKVIEGVRDGNPFPPRTITRTNTFSLATLEVREHDLRVELRFERLREVVSESGTERVRDSSATSEEEAWPQSAQMLEPMIFGLSPTGKVGALERTFGGVDPKTQPPAVAKQLRTAVVDGFVRTLSLSLLGTFPEESIGPGAAWKCKTIMAIPGVGTVTIDVTNTLSSVEVEDGLRVAVIDQVASPSLEGGPAPDPDGWSMDTSIRFSIDEGQIISTSGRTTMSMNPAPGAKAKLASDIRMKRLGPSSD